ncbi:MAG: hypothetical protein SFX18_08725 [Pirellulales bacterium]|nr:hypothetical protein [Pirellulales bacterium]
MSEPQETICGYKVHPAASIFPLVEGEEFENLVYSIERFGLLEPIVFFDGVLVDGRNRLRAIEHLKSLGKWRDDIPRTEWEPQCKNTLSQWIYETNATRRHLTEDQRVAASACIVPLIEAENEAKQKATQFEKGKSGNPTGKAKEQAETKSSPPDKRDTKAKDANSTVGKVAARAGTSMHKARQAVALAKAEAAGHVPEGTLQQVASGALKLKDAIPQKPKRVELLDSDPDVDGDEPGDLKAKTDEIFRSAKYRLKSLGAWLRKTRAPSAEQDKLQTLLIPVRQLLRKAAKTLATQRIMKNKSRTV